MLNPDHQTLSRNIREPASLALAGVLRERRERHGWTLDELAARSGLSRQMLGYIELHQRTATTETVGRIGRALGEPGNLAYYNSTGDASKRGKTSARDIHDDLSTRYPGRSSAKTPQTTPK